MPSSIKIKLFSFIKCAMFFFSFNVIEWVVGLFNSGIRYIPLRFSFLHNESNALKSILSFTRGSGIKRIPKAFASVLSAG